MALRKARRAGPSVHARQRRKVPAPRAGLAAQLAESRAREAATAAILKVIRRSPRDAQPVFDAIVRSAMRLVGGNSCSVTRVADGHLHLVAFNSTDPATDKALRALYPEPIGQRRIVLEAVRTGRPQSITNVPAKVSAARNRAAPAVVRARKIGSLLLVPLLRERKAIGLIHVARAGIGGFSPQQIKLIQTFADQAAIAIENARRFHETKEALERQTATGEILKIIARSPADVQPVFDAIASSAARLLGGFSAAVFRLQDGIVQLAALASATRRGEQVLRRNYPKPVEGLPGLARVARTGDALVHRDLQTDTTVPEEVRATAKARGHRANVVVPMTRGESVIGFISVTRREALDFSAHHVELLKTFADQAVIAIENVRLFNETKEALERQTATAEILRVIARSPSNVQPVFDAIAESARRLLNGNAAVVARRVGEMLHLAAYTSTGEAGDAALKKMLPAKIAGQGHTGKAILTAAPVLVADVETDPDYSDAYRVAARERGFRSVLSAPIMLEGEPIGVVSVYRPAAGKFSEHQTNLLRTFTDQAVIAIENVRLFNETKEALERQTATAEILRVMSNTQTDTQPVFDTIVNSTQRLIAGRSAVLLLRRDPNFVVAAYAGPAVADLPEEVRVAPLDPEKNFPSRAILDGDVVHVPDWERADIPEHEQVVAKTFGVKASLMVPLLREGRGIGAIAVTRGAAGPFHEKEIALLRSFADQAVIAIENVRLFNETKEALERQTASSDILRIVARSMADATPVFEAILASVLRLFEGFDATVWTVRDDHLESVVRGGETLDPNVVVRVPLVPEQPYTGVVLEGKMLRLEDVEGNPELSDAARARFRARGRKAVLMVPLMRDRKVIGALSVSRPTVYRFSDAQVALLANFADQAVIAIENARLFNETKEALERQTATAEILKVISGSPTDTQPVFDAIVRSGLTLFSGAGVSIGTVVGEEIVVQAAEGMGGIGKGFRFPLSRESASGTAILERRVVNIPDTEAPGVPLHARENARRLNVRSMTQAPMFREGVPIGSIGVMLKEPGGLDEKELALLRTFADQAVIAIENVRLFRELKKRTKALTRSVQQLIALGEVGRTISSTLELDTVLQTIVQHAVALTGLDAGAIYEYDEAREHFGLQAAQNMDPALVDAVRRTPIRKGDGATGSVAVTLEPMQVADLESDSYRGSRKDALARAGYRAVLAVPLLREEHLLGALQVFRRGPGEFAPEVVDLLKTFATQSAMAIQNARLFREIAEKGKQLEVASRHKSQFLASMSHELRTPLNAILGFNEMILGGIYGEVPADMREPVEDIQKSGKHLLGLINNVLDLAKIEAGRMELALSDYSVHDIVESVRATLRPLAEQKGLALEVALPGDLPLAHGDAGRLRQCLMNLAGNSLKFTKQGKVGVAVDLRDGAMLRFRVEDTGIGIPEDKIGSLFTEFKQTDATIASEYGGTGLGLSITKKFIEMHGGRIWVESEVGRGSTFLFEVPLRAGA